MEAREDIAKTLGSGVSRMQLSDSQLLKRGVREAAKAPATRHEPLPNIADGRTRPVCLLATCHPERGLSRLLTQHLGEEMPNVAFTLRAADDVSAVWIRGYEPGATKLVSIIRYRYPDALLLVTGRGNPKEWREEVLGAGADLAAGWPLPYEKLSRLLRVRREAI